MFAEAALSDKSQQRGRVKPIIYKQHKITLIRVNWTKIVTN